MSDVTLPRDFVPLQTSTPKKERDVMKKLLEEVKLMDLECETIAVMEEINNPVPENSVKGNFYATL